jgi:RNA polymerase sigma-70 factor (ECF subfamily)
MADEMEPELDAVGQLDVRYAAFLQTVTHLRASLHRYCARMTGSVLDGEDVMQEALFEAYRKLASLEEPGAMRSWLFRVAHRRCLDFAKKRAVRRGAEQALGGSDAVAPHEPAGPGLGHAVERLVIHLPPKERACVLLKDVFDLSLEEIAELVDSTPGGVKSALSRARAKLATLAASPEGDRAATPDAERSKLLELYVEHFNRRDWDAVRALTSADARLRVSDRFAGRLAESPYFSRYEHSAWRWAMSLGEVDGEAVVIMQSPVADGWQPTSVVRIDVEDGRIVRIHDYYHCPWIIGAADVRVLSAPSQHKPQESNHG